MFEGDLGLKVEMGRGGLKRKVLCSNSNGVCLLFVQTITLWNASHIYGRKRVLTHSTHNGMIVCVLLWGTATDECNRI